MNCVQFNLFLKSLIGLKLTFLKPADTLVQKHWDFKNILCSWFCTSYITSLSPPLGVWCEALVCEMALMKVCTEGSVSAGTDWMSSPLSLLHGSLYSHRPRLRILEEMERFTCRYSAVIDQ